MYTLNVPTSVVTRDLDNVQIEPTSDVTSVDYQDYMQWLNAGNRPTETFIEIAEKVNILRPEDFEDRFTIQERLAMLQAAETDDLMKLLLMRAQTATVVVLDSEKTIQGIMYMVQKGIISMERANEILNG